MSEEKKDNGAAAIVAENMTELAQSVAETSPGVEDVAAAVETMGTVGSDKKGKAKGKVRGVQAKQLGGALKSVGLAACKRHKLAQVWVTADGQCFGMECDAKAHGANLKDNNILKVTKG